MSRDKKKAMSVDKKQCQETKTVQETTKEMSSDKEAN